ncbi:MAG: hypothetical protein ACYC9Y_12680 [Candidatus Methylomirabilia bacterium]
MRARTDHLAGVGVDETEDDLQQRRLAGAVGADDGDALVVPDAQREVAEEVLPAVLFLEVTDGDQGRSPLVPRVEVRDCTRVGAGVKVGRAPVARAGLVYYIVFEKQVPESIMSW